MKCIIHIVILNSLTVLAVGSLKHKFKYKFHKIFTKSLDRRYGDKIKSNREYALPAFGLTKSFMEFWTQITVTNGDLSEDL